MYTALITLEKISNTDEELTVRIDTATERMAELTAARRMAYPGYRVREVLKWELCEGTVAPVTAPAPQSTPKARPSVRRLQVTQQRAYCATVVAFSRCERPNSLADSGYDRGVLFRLDDGSEIWINDCVAYWNSVGITPGEVVTVLNVGSVHAPVWLFSGRCDARQAA